MAGAVLKLRVAAAPTDGAANAAVEAMLAKALKLRRSDVRILSGAASRTKIVGLERVTADAIAAAFGPPPPA